MTFTAKVHNGAIPLPPGIDLPEGAQVEVEAREASVRPAESRHGWLKKYVGILKDLPPDFAAEHDHYIHGIPKRAGR